MKLTDLIQNVDKSKKENMYISEELGRELQLEVYYTEQDRLMAYPISQWYCTDTYVGSNMYFFDGGFVAMSHQPARKSSTTFQWATQRAYDTVREYVKNLEEIEDELETPDLITDLNEEMGIGYRIHYCSQLFNFHMDSATLDGKPVEIIEKENKDYAATKVKIKEENNEERWIEISKLVFKWMTD